MLRATPVSSLADIDTAEGKRRYVRSLFDTIADRYDLITVVLSYGRDRAWKRRLVGLAGPVAGRRALDLATGTGDIAHLLHDAGARVVGLDVTQRMIELAREKCPGGSRPEFLVGDMMALPFASGTFDVVTTGYGLRNVPDLAVSLNEIARVLKPGGVLLSLDFTRPRQSLLRAVYLKYLEVVGGALGWALHGDGDTYRYIPASLRRYPDAAALTTMIAARGFERARYLPVLGGLMAIHEAFRRE